MDKKISEMTEKEILRKQLELLAEISKESLAEELPQLSMAMCEIHKLLHVLEPKKAEKSFEEKAEKWFF